VAAEFLACQIITLPRWQVKDDSPGNGRLCHAGETSLFRHGREKPNSLLYGYFYQSLFIVAQFRPLFP
jgi:hypothetical protein